MAVPTMEESALCSQLIERVKDYFQSAEHKKEFEEWYGNCSADILDVAA